MSRVVWLKEVGKNDVAVAGGKGAQLGELKKTGFNVPEGFVITTEVYQELVKKIGNSIQDSLSGLDIENTKALENASAKIRKLIVSTDLPAGIEKEITESRSKLGKLVAVRSSATAEDQKEASFAGQMATFLDVTEDKLIESVKKCIASLFSARAIYYREQKKIRLKDVSIAVVVQRMVAAKKAGVAFSVNPLDNNEKEIIIEATSGLGEALVSGKITPDSYVVDKESSRIKESHSRGKSPVLNESEIILIASAIKKIEQRYEVPQDIEWAIDERDVLYILQARPITTLGLKKPVWRKIIAREYGVQYTELSIKCLSPLNQHIVPAPFYEQAYIPEGVNEACYIDETKWNEFVFALKKRYVESPDNYGEFEKSFTKAGSEYMETSKAISQHKLKGKSNAELKQIYLDYLEKNNAYGPFIWMQFIINNFFAEKAKEIITNKLGKDSKDIYDYIEAALKPYKKAASIQLSEVAAKWDKLSETEKKKAYENFKWVPCLDVHNKPWTEKEFHSHISEFKKTDKMNFVSYENLVKELHLSEKEEQVLEIAKSLSYLKDLKDDFRRQGIFYVQSLFEEIANRIGIGIKEASYATEEEIIDFLDGGKAIPKAAIEERKKGFAIYFDRDKKIQCKSGKDIETALNELGIVVFEEFSEEIKGTPASAGKAKGRAVIIRGVSDLNKVKKGDILVAVTTHPDYIPAMQKAVAIVTDEGGITSHAAIVARELGLPCVVGTKYATRALKDGDKVEIDAGAGIVRKIKKD